MPLVGGDPNTQAGYSCNSLRTNKDRTEYRIILSNAKVKASRVREKFSGQSLSKTTNMPRIQLKQHRVHARKSKPQIKRTRLWPKNIGENSSSNLSREKEQTEYKQSDKPENKGTKTQNGKSDRQISNFSVLSANYIG